MGQDYHGIRGIAAGFGQGETEVGDDESQCDDDDCCAFLFMSEQDFRQGSEVGVLLEIERHSVEIFLLISDVENSNKRQVEQCGCWSN